MAIFTTDIPYCKTQPKRVFLPMKDPINNKVGFGSLVFLFTKNLTESIGIINNTDNCVHNNKYYWYYYPKKYMGKINGRRYNVKDLQKQKEIYTIINEKCTPVKAHPLTPLNAGANKNCYYDMSKYMEIYDYMSAKFSTGKMITSFWNYFKSIWFSQETVTYPYKTVLIDVNPYDNFTSGTFKEKLHNPLFMIYYTLYKYPELISDINIDFVFYSGRYVLRINPQKMGVDKKTYISFYREIQYLLRKKMPTELSPENIKTSDQQAAIEETLKAKYNFVGDSDDTDDVTNEHLKSTKTSSKKQMQEKIDQKINTSVHTNTETITNIVLDNASKSDVSDYVTAQTEIDLENDAQLTEDLYKFMQKEKVPTTPLSSARDAMMRKKQESLKIKNISFSNLKNEKASNHIIPEHKLGSTIKTINKNVKTVKYNNINKAYIENVMASDIAKVFTCLNTKDMKLFVRDIKVEDSSDEFNYKETYKVVLEDELKQRHNITVDIPKFVDNKFLYLGSNKKIINRQNFLYPVVKTGPETVQIVTNYNKIFLRRVGTKSISSVDRMVKLISSNPACLEYFKTGNVGASNKHVITSIEYDEFSKVLLEFKTRRCFIMFNQGDAEAYLEKHNISLFDNPKYTFIGIRDNDYLFIDTDDQLVKSINPSDIDSGDTDADLASVMTQGMTISDLIISELPDELHDEFKKIRATKRLMYTTATIMSQAIPFMVLLMFWEGFSSVIKKLGLKYEFSKSYPKVLRSSQSVVRFKDCYFVYDEDMATSLLMNGLKLLDTENHTIEEYNTQEPYVEFFAKKYGKANIMNAIYNYYEFMLDPITLEVLEDINLPTDLITLGIYANSLLADDSYTMENSQILSRIRSTEIIPALLYISLSAEYLTFKNSAGKKKISLPRDCVIKQLLALQTVEDYSVLNPVVELEKDRAITAKGLRGINVQRAYSEEKRSYDDTMLGVISIDTSPDANVGISRFLTMEPKITSIRGYVDVTDPKDYDTLKDVNLFSPAELLYPLGNTRDDPVRVAMACKQSKHVIPVKNAIPALISNGSDEALRFSLSTDFVVNAEEDGEVVDYNDKSKILMLRYKSGKCQAVNLAPQVVKNGGGGFFLSNTLISPYGIGDKFKKDDAIAWHKDFFQKTKLTDLRMNVGVLEKVAIMSSYDTYNDSTVITQKMADECAADMTFRKQIVVGKNSNIFDMRQIGESVSIGDTLMSFDTSFDDSDLNKMLAKLSDADKEILNENSRNIVKSKYAGKIIDIQIYSTVDLEELSPSLQKIVKNHYNKISNKKSFVSKYDSPDNKSIVKCGLMLNETTKKVVPNVYGVVRGQKLEDEVLVEYYIEHADIMGVGDKLAYFTALKSIVGEVITEGYEPYSEYRPDEEVSSLIGPSAILKRQVPSIILTVLGNKVIVELKRHLQDLFKTGNRKAMEKLVYDTFTALDKTGDNTKKYKEIFSNMTDTQFNRFFKELFDDHASYLILDMCDYERDLSMDDIVDAAKVLNVPLFEHVAFPHYTMDKEHVVVSKEPIPVGYCHIKRTQQTLAKKNGISTTVDTRSALTGQVTGADKNGRESDLENSMLIALGMENLLKELNGPRADDPIMKQQMYTEINNKGYFSLDELESDPANKTTLNTVNTFFLGMGLNTDLVTKGLMTKKTLEDET